MDYDRLRCIYGRSKKSVFGNMENFYFSDRRISDLQGLIRLGFRNTVHPFKLGHRCLPSDNDN
jgi:hypothetical protein